MHEITMKIEDLFSALAEYENLQYVEEKEVFQSTPLLVQDENNSWIPIKALITKSGESVKMEFERNVSLECSEKHLISVDGKNCVESSDLQIGEEVIFREEKIQLLAKESLGKQKLFDIMVDSPTHLYRTTNGLLHHNTTIANYIASHYQKYDKQNKVLFVDLEQTFDESYARAVGLDTHEDKFIFFRPADGEEAFETIQTLIKTKEIGIVIVDSVATMGSRSEMTDEYGKANFGATAKLMSQGLRKLNPWIARTNTTIIFINQIRASMDMYKPEATTGGKALPFYASWRARVSRVQDINENGELIGNTIKVVNKKSKIGYPKRLVIVDLIYADGFETFNEYIDFAVRFSLLNQGGGGNYSDNLGWNMKIRGKANLKEWLKSSPAQFDELKNKVNEIFYSTKHDDLEKEEEATEDGYGDMEVTEKDFNPEEFVSSEKMEKQLSEDPYEPSTLDH
jgi:recombination protein RecA